MFTVYSVVIEDHLQSFWKFMKTIDSIESKGLGLNVERAKVKSKVDSGPLLSSFW